MNEPKKPSESPDESLAVLPPTPIHEASVPLACNVGLGTLALVVAGAGAIVLVAGSMTPTMGATRSTKLEWEKRQLQMEQAERDFQVNSQVDAEANHPNDAQPNPGDQD